MLVAVLCAYRPAWNGQPVWDDDGHMTKPELRSTAGLGRIWTELGATQQYYPLVHTVFWLEHRLFGDSTTGYHLLSILLHCAGRQRRGPRQDDGPTSHEPSGDREGSGGRLVRRPTMNRLLLSG